MAAPTKAQMMDSLDLTYIRAQINQHWEIVETSGDKIAKLQDEIAKLQDENKRLKDEANKKETGGAPESTELQDEIAKLRDENKRLKYEVDKQKTSSAEKNYKLQDENERLKYELENERKKTRGGKSEPRSQPKPLCCCDDLAECKKKVKRLEIKVDCGKKKIEILERRLRVPPKPKIEYVTKYVKVPQYITKYVQVPQYITKYVQVPQYVSRPIQQSYNYMRARWGNWGRGPLWG